MNTRSAGSLVTHPVDTSIVGIRPVTVKGERLPTDATPLIAVVDGERIVIPPGGALIEKWKAEVILESMTNRHTYTDELLAEIGVPEGHPDYIRFYGAAIEPEEFTHVVKSYCKFTVTEPTRQQLERVLAPADEDEFARVADLNSRYGRIAIDHGEEIKAAMSANPGASVEKLFEAFALAFLTNED